MTEDPRRAFARICTSISDAAVDQDGFVSVRKLMAGFRAELIVRPLLVEGMLMGPGTADSSDVAQGAAWRVLVDKETYPFSTYDYETESAARPLPARARFTIAHELTHSLSFRCDEFGVRLAREKTRTETQAVLTKRLESETDSLSPLLLIAEAELERFCADHSDGLTIKAITTARTRWGVSRDALVSRFELLRVIDSRALRDRGCLRNVAIGIGEWIDEGRAILRSWRLFLSFDGNVFPSFLIGIRGRENVDIHATFPQSEFWLNGGRESEAIAEVSAGTFANPACERLTTSFSVETVDRKPGRRFLILVRSVA